MNLACGHRPGGRCRPTRWTGLAVLPLLPLGCASPATEAAPRVAATRAGDLACPRCRLVEHVWDDRSRWGHTVHHDVWVMECPCCAGVPPDAVIRGPGGGN